MEALFVQYHLLLSLIMLLVHWRYCIIVKNSVGGRKRRSVGEKAETEGRRRRRESSSGSRICREEKGREDIIHRVNA